MKKIFYGIGRIFAELLILFPTLYIFAGVTQGDTMMKYMWLAEIAIVLILSLVICTVFDNVVLQILFGLVFNYGVFYLIGKNFGVFPNAFIIPGLIVPFLFWRGKQHAEYGWDEILPTTIVMVVLVINLVIAAFTNILGGMAQYRMLINIVGPFSYVMAVIVMNRLNLRDLSEEMHSHTMGNTTTVASDMNIVNNILMAVLVIVGFIFSFGAVLRRIVKFIAKWIGVLLRFLYKILFDFDPSVPSSGGPAQVAEDAEMGTMVIKEGNMTIWGPVFTVLGYIFVAVVCVFFVWLLWKGLKKIWKLLMEAFRKFAEAAGSGVELGMKSYEDKRELSVNLADLPKRYMQEARERLGDMFAREPKWSEIPTIAEKVRYLYKYTLKKSVRAGYSHNSGYTPKEAMKKASEHYLVLPEFSDELVREYELVRYGEKDPEENDVEALKNKMKI